MSKAFAVCSLTGSGKTTSMGKIDQIGHKGLDWSTTALINVKGKPLPFSIGDKDLVKVVMSFDQVNNRYVVNTPGNYLVSVNPMEIISYLMFINTASKIKTVIIDDFQYIMAEEYMATSHIKGYEKFSKMAANAYYVLKAGLELRDDIVFGILTHAEPLTDGSAIVGYKMKTIGKMLDEKVTLEGLFTTLLFSDVVKNTETGKMEYLFVTNATEKFPLAKSPIGMFESTYIANDLGNVVERIRTF